MVPLMHPSAEFIGELVTKDADPEAPFKVLDIAAGHGIFGIHIATRHPEAEIVALDSPGVLEVAAENAERFGVGDRHTRLPGSAFDVEFGNGYDVVLLTNFFHHFDIPTCTDLMRKVRGALNPGGRAVTLEFVPNEDRVTPPEQASFSLGRRRATRTRSISTTACSAKPASRPASCIACKGRRNPSSCRRNRSLRRGPPFPCADASFGGGFPSRLTAPLTTWMDDENH
jgi:hypothetical protein